MLSRKHCIKSSRENLVRLAMFLHLNIKDSWSHKHLASLVYWRASRHTKKLELISRSFI